jgi:hypothetical protein
MSTRGKGTKEERTPKEPTTTRQQVQDFERIGMQFTVLYQEFAVQAKSKPDNPINKFKLKMLNDKLGVANSVLTGPFKPFAGFDLFDDADFPTNSDVALVLRTYLESLERWRSAHVYNDAVGNWYWRTDDKPKIEADSHRIPLFNPARK